ncbi:uncharacterized protein METZ01_LOCUS309119, partial [marine metagenome]
MQNFIAQSMRRAGLAPANKGSVTDVSPTRNDATGTEPLAHMKVGSKWSYATLEYPSDIQQRTDLGHYMMFYINVADSNRSAYSTYNPMGADLKGNAKVKDSSGKEVEQRLDNPSRALREGKEWANDAGSDTWTKGKNNWTPGQSEKVVKREHNQGRLSKQFGNQQRTQRTSDSIVLYMPPTISTNTNAVYKGTEMGGFSSELIGRVESIYSRAQAIGTVNAIAEAIPGLGLSAMDDVQRGIGKAVSAIIGGDLVGGQDKLSNRAQNRYLESTFDSVGFRKFSYTFKFTPKNVQEVFTVRKIIKTFRFHMSPELPDAGDFVRYFVVPAEFDLFYMFRGDENTWLNKISSCVLVNMDVSYANG